MTPSITITRLTGFGRGQAAPHAQASLLLGTDASCDVRFDPAWDKTVSARHAKLTFENNEWWLEDSSRDGCFLDGRRISREKLVPGSVIELGKGGPRIRLDFETVTARSATSPVPDAATESPRLESTRKLAEAKMKQQPAPLPAQPPAPQSIHRAGPNWALVGAIAVIVLLLAGVGVWYLIENSSPDAKLMAVARQYENAVGVVTWMDEGHGTAWAVGDHVFASNSHVTQPVQQLLSNGVPVYVLLNKNPTKRFRVTKAVVHPRYAVPQDEESKKRYALNNINFAGQPSAVTAYDVGLLYVEERTDNHFHIAPKAELEKLDSGYRVAFLGFPMERMQGGGINIKYPVATMQSGILTSATDYWLSKAEFVNRLLLQHNLGATGGASGSPIFNVRGEVVGVLSAGNIIGQVVSGQGKVEVARAPSAVMVNFAQRIDCLKDILPEYPRN